jgi:cell division protein FtsL
MQSVVLATLLQGAENFKKLAIALVVGIVLLALGRHIMQDNNRGAWSSAPMVIFILIIASAAGVVALRSFGLNVLDFAQGK